MSRTDIATRTIAAPIDVIYAALASAEARARWLPPTGMTGRFVHFDLRAGGGYRMVLTYDDARDAPGKTTATEDVVDVRFVEVVPGARIVEAVTFAAEDPAFAGEMTMTWALRAVPGGTEVTVTARDVPSGITAEDHAAGLAASLANLATFVL